MDTIDAVGYNTEKLESGYLIRFSSKASASNFTGSFFPSKEAAFFTIKRNVHTCA